MNDAELVGFARNVVPLESGIWISPSNPERVSFPEQGHEECYELEDGSFWFRHRNQCIIDLVDRFPPAGPIFDVGGGNGFVSLGLQRAGRQAVLVEPGLEGPRFAKKRGLSPVICATIEDAGFAPGSLPAIGVFDVVEHIEDDAGFVAKLRAVLRTAGRLYLTVPAFSSLWSAEDDYAGHFRRYRLGQIERLLTSHSFKVDFASYFFAPLPLPIFLLRSLPARLGRKPASTTEKVKNEHKPSASAGKAIDWVLERERKWLRAGRRLPFGSSCIIAATAV